MRSRYVLRAGSVALGVTWALALSSGPARAAATLHPARASLHPAATLTIRTVPAVPGARVTIDGTTYVTDGRGVVTIGTSPGRHQVDIKPPSAHVAGTGVRFSRWLDGIALADRVFMLHPGDNREEAGFELSYPVRVRFVTKDGTPVPMSAISSVTMANSLGGRFTFAPSDPPALLVANRIVRIQSGLVPQPIRYSVRTVLYGGSNVVYAGSENFYVRPNQLWTVKILLFPMRLEVRDALFGFGIGTAVLIRRSDGARRLVPLGAGHAVTVPNMPRATYELVAKGPGFGLSAPATLTKPLVAKLLLLSWIDIAAVATFIVLFVVGLPLLGGRLIRRRGRRLRLLAWHAGDPEAAAEVGPSGALAEPERSGVLGEAVASASDAVGEPGPEAVQEWRPAPPDVPLPESFAPMPGGAPAEDEPAGDDDSTETFPAIVASVPGPTADPDPPEPGKVA
jgi:hypothetical protein